MLIAVLMVDDGDVNGNQNKGAGHGGWSHGGDSGDGAGDSGYQGELILHFN